MRMLIRLRKSSTFVDFNFMFINFLLTEKVINNDVAVLFGQNEKQYTEIDTLGLPSNFKYLTYFVVCTVLEL